MMRFHTSRKKRITVNCGRIAVALSGGPPAHQRRGDEEEENTAHGPRLRHGAEVWATCRQTVKCRRVSLRHVRGSRTASLEEDLKCSLLSAWSLRGSALVSVAMRLSDPWLELTETTFNYCVSWQIKLVILSNDFIKKWFHYFYKPPLQVENVFYPWTIWNLEKSCIINTQRCTKTWWRQKRKQPLSLITGNKNTFLRVSGLN